MENLSVSVSLSLKLFQVKKKKKVMKDTLEEVKRKPREEKALIDDVFCRVLISSIRQVLLQLGNPSLRMQVMPSRVQGR